MGGVALGYARAVALRAVTGIGAGVKAGEALATAGLAASVTHAEAVPVPAGANGSKVGTFIQRAALDPAALADVPDDLREMVGDFATRLAGDTSLALAIDMSASPAGPKMLARLAPADPAASPWLVFALVESPDTPGSG